MVLNRSSNFGTIGTTYSVKRKVENWLLKKENDFIPNFEFLTSSTIFFGKPSSLILENNQIPTLKALSTNSKRPSLCKMYILLDPLFLELIVKCKSSELAQPVRDTQAVFSFSR